MRPASSLWDHPLWGRLLQIAAGPVLFFLVWYLAQTFGHLRLIPPPVATMVATWQALAHGSMLFDLYRTLYRVLYAFVLAAVFGVPIGIVIGATERLYRGSEFLIDFFRSTPATAMFPLFMLLFGLDEFSRIALAAFSAWLIITFNVGYGVLNARKTRVLAAQSMGASRLRVFATVIFFETLPQTFVGLRTGISIALVVIVVAEMFIGSVDGLGHRIIDAQISYNLKDLYGSILISGGLGYCLNYFFLAIERVFIHWAGR
jgi:NitT/TauT family transport system permease protein